MVFHLFYDNVLKRNRETDIAFYVRHWRTIWSNETYTNIIVNFSSAPLIMRKTCEYPCSVHIVHIFIYFRIVFVVLSLLCLS